GFSEHLGVARAFGDDEQPERAGHSTPTPAGRVRVQRGFDLILVEAHRVMSVIAAVTRSRPALPA
ncbi:MAG: hypothetical protein WBH15_06915, partial [Candidatus Methanoculleus thermohydrogenotrophicum]